MLSLIIKETMTIIHEFAMRSSTSDYYALRAEKAEKLAGVAYLPVLKVEAIII